MHATYNESRLLNVMTALENIINLHLPKNDTRTLSDNQFRRLRAAVQETIDQFLARESSLATRPLLSEELSEKVIELQRRPIKRKWRSLAEQWEIPLDGLTPESIDEAISARNSIVHEGVYYRPNVEQTDLWSHFTAIRELVIRVIFVAIGFKGRYISHHGGYHWATFPPASTSSESQSAPA